MGIFKNTGIYKGPGIYKTGAASGGGGGGMPMPEGYEQIEKLSIQVGTKRGILLNLGNWNNPKICIEFVYTTDNNGLSFTFNGTSRYLDNDITDGNRYLSYRGRIGTWPGEINITRLKDDSTLNKVIFSNSLDWNGRLFSLNFPAFSSFCIGSRPWGSPCVGMDVYSVLVRDSSDNIVLFGVPAKRILDEVEGILDVLTNTFITP